MSKYELSVTLKITEHEGIILGCSVMLFNKFRYVAGLWHDSVVFSILDPKTMEDCQVLIYTIEELKELIKNGDLKGTVEIDG